MNNQDVNNTTATTSSSSEDKFKNKTRKRRWDEPASVTVTPQLTLPASSTSTSGF